MTVSRANLFSGVLLAAFLSAGTGSNAAQQTIKTEPKATVSAARIFQQGQDALSVGQLDEAERDFRRVLAINANSGEAYANLGVVEMRRKHWDAALTMLHKAQRLMPNAAGVQLDIGLVYFRRSQFSKATSRLEFVVQNQPNSAQARYLLGLCYFFQDRWKNAAETMEPLWPQDSAQLPYLYVLANAAHRGGRDDLDQRATAQLLKLADGSAAYHLFVGKYYLNLGREDEALKEFQSAAQSDPNLPFAHFNLGVAYVRKQDFASARAEFLKDSRIEPDMALNYEELGNLDWLLQHDNEAETDYREALRRNPRLASSHLGLARIDQRRENYPAALAEADAALKIDPARADAHYVRGQILLHLRRKVEAGKELAVARKKEDSSELSGSQPTDPVPSPELLQDSK